MGTIDEKACTAKTDSKVFSELLQEQRHFIMKCTSKICHRFISDTDDEWSIALIAFSDAVRDYDESKGSFMAFAELKITHSLVDYYRSRKRFNREISATPQLFEEGEETEDRNLRIQVTQKLTTFVDTSIQDEIEAANQVFVRFGFTFYGLTESSPKSAKTREACKIAVLYFLENPDLRQELFTSLQLPMKQLEKNTGLPRKLLERHRRYIIAAVEILGGGYPKLAEYLSFIRKDGNR